MLFRSKLVKKCSLPLTGTKVVDMIITNLGVFEIRDGKLYMIELAPGVTKDEVTAKTQAAFQFDLNGAAGAAA